MWNGFIRLIDPSPSIDHEEVDAASEKETDARSSTVHDVEAAEKEGNASESDDLQCTLSTLEVDYVKNPTPLYKKVQQENWKAVTNFLDSGYWPGSFNADPVPPTDQARTWVTYFDEKDREKFHWSILPLHLAIILDAPFTVIERLVDLYPDSVKCTDDQNMLPLHIAMRHGGSNRVIDFLFCAFPEALQAKGKNNLTPLDCAIQGKDLVRARILSTFIEKSNDEATEVAASQFSEKIASLKARIRSKEAALGDAKSRLEVLEELNELVAQLRESEQAAEALKNSTRDEPAPEPSESYEETQLKDEPTPEPQKYEPIVNEAQATREKSLEQPVQQPDRLSKGIKKLKSSILRRTGGGKDTKSVSMKSIGQSKTWHASKIKFDESFDKNSVTGPIAKAERQGSDKFLSRTEKDERKAFEHSVPPRDGSKAEQPPNQKWSFLKGKEKSDMVARQHSKSSQRSRAYSEDPHGVIRQRQTNDKTKSKRSTLSKSDPVVDNRSKESVQNAFDKNSPNKTKEVQQHSPSAKEAYAPEGQLAMENDYERVKERIRQQRGNEATGEAREEAVTNHPRQKERASKSLSRSDDQKDKEVSRGKPPLHTHPDSTGESNDSTANRNAARPANLDKLKAKSSHAADGPLPQSKNKDAVKESSEYKDAARRHRLRAKQKEETIKRHASEKKKNEAFVDKKATKSTQRTNDMKKTASTKNKETIDDPLLRRRRLNVQPEKKPLRSVSKSRRQPKESLRSDSKSKSQTKKDERVDSSERRQNSKGTGERATRSERREPAPSSSRGTSKKRSNSQTKKARKTTSKREEPITEQTQATDAHHAKTSSHRIKELMRQTVLLNAFSEEIQMVTAPSPFQHKLGTATTKGKPSAPRQEHHRSPRYTEADGVEAHGIASGGDDSCCDSHSSASSASAYSTDDEDDDDDVSSSAFTDGTGSSCYGDSSTGSNLSEEEEEEESGIWKHLSEESSIWNPWNVWTM